ncbi:MAG: hypothetical protein V9G13_00315 [Marmoricola sp.]
MSEWKAIEPTDLNPTLLGKVFMVRSRGEAGSSGIVGTLAWYGESEAEGVRIGLHGLDPIVLHFGKHARQTIGLSAPDHPGADHQAAHPRRHFSPTRHPRQVTCLHAGISRPTPADHRRGRAQA